MGLTVAVRLPFRLILMLQCQPVREFWQRTGDGYCIDTEYILDVAYFYSATACLCDFLYEIARAIEILLTLTARGLWKWHMGLERQRKPSPDKVYALVEQHSKICPAMENSTFGRVLSDASSLFQDSHGKKFGTRRGVVVVRNGNTDWVVSEAATSRSSRPQLLAKPFVEAHHCV